MAAIRSGHRVVSIATRLLIFLISQFILKILQDNVRLTSESLYDVLSLSNVSSVEYAVRRLMINLSNSLSMARYYYGKINLIIHKNINQFQVVNGQWSIVRVITIVQCRAFWHFHQFCQWFFTPRKLIILMRLINPYHQPTKQVEMIIIPQR